MNPGNRIREYRMKAGLTQTELANAVNLSQGQLSNIENEGRNVSLEWLRALAKALRVSVADLLADEDNPGRLSPAEELLVDRYREADASAQDYLLMTAKAVTAAREEKVA